MSERDEIEQVLRRTIVDTSFERGCAHTDLAEIPASADALIAANVRHLPSLADDPEMVDRVARKMCLGFTNDTKREAMVGYRIMARDLLHALAGGE